MPDSYPHIFMYHFTVDNINLQKYNVCLMIQVNIITDVLMYWAVVVKVYLFSMNTHHAFYRKKVLGCLNVMLFHGCLLFRVIVYFLDNFDIDSLWYLIDIYLYIFNCKIYHCLKMISYLLFWYIFVHNMKLGPHNLQFCK